MSVLRCLLLVPLILFASTGCTRKPPVLHRISGHFRQNHYHIRWWTSGKINSQTLDKKVHQTLAEAFDQVGLADPHSVLAAFNHSRSTQWQSMPRDLISLLEIAKIVHTLSRGCYDPTVKPLIDLWGFRDDMLHVPDASQIADARSRIGLERLQIDKLRHRVRKTVPDLALDLGSVEIGYGLWRISRVFDRAGVDNYLISLDGDLMATGHRTDGKRWRVEIKRSLPGEASISKKVSIDNEDGVSIDTAATHRQFLAAGGKAYSRVISPRTGAPVTHNLISATVFGSDPRMTDAWSTAMLCMGKKEGEKVAERLDLKVLFIQRESNFLLESESPELQNTSDVTVH